MAVSSQPWRLVGNRARVLLVGLVLFSGACTPVFYDEASPPNPTPSLWTPAETTTSVSFSDWADSGPEYGCTTPTSSTAGDTITKSWTCKQDQVRNKTTTTYYWQQYWRYLFWHHNVYTNNTVSDCYVTFAADTYDDFGQPGNYGTLLYPTVNTWGTLISKSPDGHGDLESGHGCGHTGTLNAHYEWVRIQRVISLQRPPVLSVVSQSQTLNVPHTSTEYRVKPT